MKQSGSNRLQIFTSHCLSVEFVCVSVQEMHKSRVVLWCSYRGQRSWWRWWRNANQVLWSFLITNRGSRCLSLLFSIITLSAFLGHLFHFLWTCIMCHDPAPRSYSAAERQLPIPGVKSDWGNGSNGVDSSHAKNQTCASDSLEVTWDQIKM